MTMLTIIVSSVCCCASGSRADRHVLRDGVAGMVCPRFGLGPDHHRLKTGYWLGSTPAAQERVKFYGAIVSAIAAAAPSCCWRTFQFGEAAVGDVRPCCAPQPHHEGLVGLMSQQPVAWILSERAP